MSDVTPMPKSGERIFAYPKFNLDTLLSLATQLRGGRPCTTDVSKRPKSGSLNWVIFIAFEHGIEWVLRSPRRSLSITSESHSKMTISEASTLKYLGKHSSVPVRSLFLQIRVPYILMSKASGWTLSLYDWSEAFRIPGYSTQVPLLPLTDHDREKIMGQLGSIMASLSEIHFVKIGSLFEVEDGSSDCSVGECLSPSLLWERRETLEGIDRGPFDQESQYLSSLISAFVSHAKELRLAPHSFFAPIPDPFECPDWTSYNIAVDMWESVCLIRDGMEGSQNRLSYCLAGEFLYQMIPSLTSHTTASEGFVPCHPDLHDGNIFVDEDFNVTCIIDWGSAYSGHLSELLATPGLSGSTSPPREWLVAAFRTSFSQGGKKVEPEQWVKAERMWRFSRLVRLLSTQDYTLFKALYELTYENGSGDIPRLFYERSMQGHSRELLAKLREEEEEDDDDESGHVKESEGLAIARKLTLMAEMNPNFVADRRLWRWIGHALDKTNSE